MAKNSLQWTAFYDEGAIKTVIKHHAKRLPQSTDVEAVFERDDMMAVNASRASAALLSSVGNDDAPAEPARPASRLDALEHKIQSEQVDQIGRAHVCTPVTNAHLVCRLLLEKHKITQTQQYKQHKRQIT